jgi:hypothetical protein
MTEVSKQHQILFKSSRLFNVPLDSCAFHRILCVLIQQSASDKPLESKLLARSSQRLIAAMPSMGSGAATLNRRTGLSVPFFAICIPPEVI